MKGEVKGKGRKKGERKDTILSASVFCIPGAFNARASEGETEIVKYRPLAIADIERIKSTKIAAVSAIKPDV